MPIPRSPLQGSRSQFASYGIDIGSVVQEESTCREMSIDGRPVKGSDVLRVAGVDEGWTIG